MGAYSFLSMIRHKKQTGQGNVCGSDTVMLAMYSSILMSTKYDFLSQYVHV